MLRADRVVTVEGPIGEGRGLADVVEERGEPHDRPVGRGGVDGPQRVVPEVLARRSCSAARRAAPRAPAAGRRAGPCRPQPQPDRRPAAPRAASRSSAATRSPERCGASRACSADRRERRRFDREVRASPRAGPRGPCAGRPRWNRRAGSPTARRQPAARSASPSNGSTSVGRRGRSSGRRRAPGHGVDREVATGEVRAEVVPELDAVGPAVVGVLVVDPEGRDLEDAAVPAHGHGPEAVLVDGAREQLDDLGPVARRWQGPSRPACGRAARRAASRPRRRPRARGDAAGRGPPRTVAGTSAVGGPPPRRPGRAPRLAQFRPRKRYILQASFRSSWRYGVNRE